MSTLPKFSSSSVFRTHRAIHDKIDLRLGRWVIQTKKDNDKEDFWQFRSALASPPTHSRELAFNKNKVYGWFFLRPQTKGKNRNKLLIRTDRLKHPVEKGRHLTGPLCGGHLEHWYVKKSDAEKNDLATREAALVLSLNFLRYMRHQPNRDGAVDDAELDTITLRKRTDDRSFSSDGEWSYDGADNWIPQTKEWQEFTSPRNRTAHFKNYLDAIWKRVESDGNRALRHLRTLGSDVGFSQIERTFSLSRVETVWEFESDEPTEDVVRIASMLMTAAKRGGTAVSFPSEDPRSRVENSISFKIHLTDNVALKVYSKTDRRIRFEVEHYLSKTTAQFAKRARLAPLPKGYWKKHQGRPMEHLAPILRAVRQDAADRLNALMKDLRREDQMFAVPLSALRLLSELSTSIPSDIVGKRRTEMVRSLLSLLVHKRGIRGGARRGRLGDAVIALRRSGVVEYDRKKGYDHLTTEYLPAARSFRKLTGDLMKSFFGYEKAPLPDRWIQSAGVWAKQR